MPETTISMAAMLSMTPQNNKLNLRFRDGANNTYCVEIPEGALGGMIVGMRSMAAAMQGTGSGQPMTLDSGRPFTLPDGRVGLEISLDGGVRLPVLFPKQAIPVLRSTLDELERLSRSAPDTPRRN